MEERQIAAVRKPIPAMEGVAVTRSPSFEAISVGIWLKKAGKQAHCSLLNVLSSGGLQKNCHTPSYLYFRGVASVLAGITCNSVGLKNLTKKSVR